MNDFPPHSDALVAYIRELQRSGRRDVLLSKAAREGLATLVPPAKAVETRLVTTHAAERAVGVRSGTIAREVPAAAPGAEWKVEITGSGKSEQLRHLSERVAQCQKCPHLVNTRTQTVFGVGNPEATLMFVGEAPGADEDKQGEPFVGAAGQLLTKMIAAMGLSREQVYIANILKCRPDMPPASSGNRKPTPVEMSTCRPYLLAQIEIIQPKVMVALGSTAIEGLLENKTAIGKMRGRFQDFRGIPLMPTFHPAYLLRNQSVTEKRKVWEDLLQVMERLHLPINDKQRGYFTKSS